MLTRIIPPGWMPTCKMERIITHWTAGDYSASSQDQDCYHFLIEGDGNLVRGHHSILDNVSTKDDDYAAHTRGLNTKSIGISCCAMGGAIESPFLPGPWPLQARQHDVLVRACADLAQRYDIPVDPNTVLNHGEVQATLGIAQHGKWDICVLPWDLKYPPAAVGGEMRRRIQAALHAAPTLPRTDGPYTVTLDGVEIAHDAFDSSGPLYVPLRPLLDALHWTAIRFRVGLATIDRGPAGTFEVGLALRGERGYVSARGLASLNKWPEPVIAAGTRTVDLRTKA